MTSAHVFYIPTLVFIGIAIGIALGRRMLIAEQEGARRRAARHQAQQELGK